MVKIREEKRPMGLTQRSYACDECGQEFAYLGLAKSCEMKHVIDRCPHPEESLEWAPDGDGDSINRTCTACGLWFNDSVRLDNLPDDQDVLQRLVDAIRAAQAHPASPRGKS